MRISQLSNKLATDAASQVSQVSGQTNQAAFDVAPALSGFDGASRARFASQQAPASDTIRPWQRIGTTGLLSPDYTASVESEIDALRQVTLSAMLSPDASSAYEAMIGAFEGLLSGGPARSNDFTAGLVSPGFYEVVQQVSQGLQSFVARAMLSPDSAKAYEDMVAALDGLLVNA